jgi:hypothetical protein
MSFPTICITPDQFDKNNLVVKELTTYRKQNVAIKTSQILYRNGANDECLFYIALPKVSTYGPYPNKGFYSKPGDDTIESYTISYSNEKTETLFKKIHDEITKKISLYQKKPKVKPIYLKNKTDNNVSYFKLKTIKENNKLKITTKFYKSQNKEIKPESIISKFGDLTPMIQIQNVYYGPHGTSEYNASIKIVVVKALFVVKESNIPDFPNDIEFPEEVDSDEDTEYNDSDLEIEAKRYNKAKM